MGFSDIFNFLFAQNKRPSQNSLFDKHEQFIGTVTMTFHANLLYDLQLIQLGLTYLVGTNKKHCFQIPTTVLLASLSKH